MKTTVIADSSGLISLVSETDQNHQKAIRVSRHLTLTGGIIIVPSDVFSETLNITGKKMSHDVAVHTAETIMTISTFMLMSPDDPMYTQAFRIFQKQSESVSFTDCIVMAFADKYETKQIFGYDSVFHKNGYTRIGVDDQP